MKVPARYLCDLCGKELNKSQICRTLFVTTNCDWTEGRPCKEHVERVEIDICDECLMKSLNIQADFQGSNIRFKED